MARRLLSLNGIAILSVVCSHAAGWGLISMVWWADRYRTVAIPSYEQFGSPTYFGLLTVLGLGSYAVPAFLFVSGFFVGYATTGSESTLNWKPVIPRLKGLLIPYLIWSIVVFGVEAAGGKVDSFVGYLTRLIIGGAHPVYFYIPLICQFYLLSPVIMRVARINAKRLFLVSVFLQLGTVSLRYIRFFGMDVPGLTNATDLLFPMYSVFFVLGIVSRLHLSTISEWLFKLRWVLLSSVVVLGFLTVLEAEMIFRWTGIRRGAGIGLFSTNLYSAAFILCFFAFRQVRVPFAKGLERLGKSSLAIYFLHPMLLEVWARAIQKYAPGILANQALFQLLLVLVGIGIPLLFMDVVSKSPARRAYRYLFG